MTIVLKYSLLFTITILRLPSFVPFMLANLLYFVFFICVVEVKVDESPVQVTLCDTAGQDFLDPLRRLCYPDSDVFLLCFSVVKPDTFASIQDKWAPNFRKSRASIVLIGTQADLRTDPRVVSTLSVNSIEFLSFGFRNQFLKLLCSLFRREMRNLFQSQMPGIMPHRLEPNISKRRRERMWVQIDHFKWINKSIVWNFFHRKMSKKLSTRPFGMHCDHSIHLSHQCGNDCFVWRRHPRITSRGLHLRTHHFIPRRDKTKRSAARSK